MAVAINKYSRGKIYKIVSDQTDRIYIGSTCQPLSARMSGHRNAMREWLKGKRDYVTSFEILNDPDARIVLVEDFSCDRKEQLLARENYYINLNRAICVNKNHAVMSVSMATYQKDYHKIYDPARKNDKWTCVECNSTSWLKDRFRHMKTSKHIANVKKIEEADIDRVFSEI